MSDDSLDAMLSLIVEEVADEWEVGGFSPDDIYGEFAILVAKRAVARLSHRDEDGAPTAEEVSRLIRFYRDGLRHGRKIAERFGAVDVVREIDETLDRGNALRTPGAGTAQK